MLNFFNKYKILNDWKYPPYVFITKIFLSFKKSENSFVFWGLKNIKLASSLIFISEASSFVWNGVIKIESLNLTRVLFLLSVEYPI